MKVLQLPHHNRVRGVNGIEQVALHYGKHLPDYGIEMADMGATVYDLVAVHAGVLEWHAGKPLVAHCHGLQWTAEYENCPDHLYQDNVQVINNLIHAAEITVPSNWVALPILRDMRKIPFVVPHGIDVERWTVRPKSGQPVVLWNKNRSSPACNPWFVQQLAANRRDIQFRSTFGQAAENLKIIGVMAHEDMQREIEQAAVYVSTAKETFGIGILEAMAAGVPVLGFAEGGNLDLVRHGVSGYLAQPGDMEDLTAGLDYCLRHGKILGENGRELAKGYTWDHVAQLVAGVYLRAIQVAPPSVAVVIPSYNYADKVGRAIESAMEQVQSCPWLVGVVVVDDGSTDGGATEKEVNKQIAQHSDSDLPLVYLRKENGGVATARNHGIRFAIDKWGAKYLCCLDADDAIAPNFLSKCIYMLEQDPSLGIAYTKLLMLLPRGERVVGRWPSDPDYNAQAAGDNQVPTCNVFRASLWRNLGGYRQRYAPAGQGAEDAEFWLRAMAAGWRCSLATEDPLFLYSYGTGRTTGNPDYREVNWLGWHPYTVSKEYPFAAPMTPKHNKPSHAARSYSSPKVTVVIPVGPGHTGLVWDAVDSVEAQTYTNWELVIVDDTGAAHDQSMQELMAACPYATFITTKGEAQRLGLARQDVDEDSPWGAGFARNRGADYARGDFLTFLDADDWLLPTYIEDTLRVWDDKEAIVYTDYARRAVVDPEMAEKAHAEGRLLHWDPKTQIATIGSDPSFTATYDCALAQRQPEYTGDPEQPVYHWCLVTCLIPRAWHYEIGGFDEQLTTWEDVEYHWRMARHGFCYTRLFKEEVIYNFHQGQRREAAHSRQTFETVVQYIKDKLEVIPMAGCSGCGGTRTAASGPVYNMQASRTNPFLEPQAPNMPQQPARGLQDSDLILVQYKSQNRGSHPVYGTTIDPTTNIQRYYGMHQAGDQFLVHKADIWDMYGTRINTLFEPVERKIRAQAPAAPQAVQAAQERPIIQQRPIQITRQPPAAPQAIGNDGAEAKILQPAGATVGAAPADVVPIPGPNDPVQIGPDTAIDLQTLPAVSAKIAQAMAARGYTTLATIKAAGADGLQEIDNIGLVKAGTILDYVDMLLDAMQDPAPEPEVVDQE